MLEWKATSLKVMTKINICNAVLAGLGFPQQFVNLVMCFTAIIMFATNISGEPCGFILGAGDIETRVSVIPESFL